ncbi:amidohydrolase family protein [Sneathiella sp. P13V-1]|uniref:metal-dependent hydrolase family protein n=1 Tax=Sneathiella sp. P13V-1 TaxID=2697366 RepID=UPI00187B115F|nr:amidohydrolase family protein [Sneathiella sp. P13V-1]MBE7635968.1 amidohydrolase family protein [Sneathiella sp. P13V-1]
MTTTLFSGGLLFDGVGEMQEGMAVLVEDANVKTIAPVGDFADYDGDRVDTSGGTLMPGIADCHVHLIYHGEANPHASVSDASASELSLRVLENAQTSLKNGITAVRDCGGKEYIEFPVRDACNSGRFLGPNIMASGRMICMTGGHGNRYGRVADGCDEVVKAVREQIHAGSDLIKIMATGGVMTPGVNPEDAHYSAEEMKAGVHEAARFHKTSASHAQGAEGIMNAVNAGITSIEHGIFMDQECLDAMLERGTYLVPTLAAVKNIINNKDKGIPQSAVDKSLRVYDRHIESFEMFYKAGGKIAMGTDAGTPFNLHGKNAMELAFMVECGMSNMDSLRAATSVGHSLMQFEDRGQIKEGFKADMLIVEGNPAEDIMQAADHENLRTVYKNGKEVMFA